MILTFGLFAKARLWSSQKSIEKMSVALGVYKQGPLKLGPPGALAMLLLIKNLPSYWSNEYPGFLAVSSSLTKYLSRGEANPHKCKLKVEQKRGPNP